MVVKHNASSAYLRIAECRHSKQGRGALSHQVLLDPTSEVSLHPALSLHLKRPTQTAQTGCCTVLHRCPILTLNRPLRCLTRVGLVLHTYRQQLVKAVSAFAKAPKTQTAGDAGTTWLSLGGVSAECRVQLLVAQVGWVQSAE